MDHEIGDALVVGNQYIVVRFKAEGEKTPDRNIVCVNDVGEILWRIQDPDEWRTGKKFFRRDLFVGIGVDKKENFWASGGESTYRVDIKTGKILEEIYTK